MMYREEDVKRVVAEVVGRYLGGKTPSFGGNREIPLEVSARHVHLTAEAFARLFGRDAVLGVKKNLSQPGEFLGDRRVTVSGEKGSIGNVAVLGPFREAVQVELSRTDCRTLGVDAPVRLSGDLRGAADVTIKADKGEIRAEGSAIVAKAHIHLTPGTAAERKLENGRTVSVKILSPRPVTLNGVAVRVSPKYSDAFHIDFDEANAAGVEDDTRAEIVY